jgi:SAM-dependent methyltransferase
MGDRMPPKGTIGRDFIVLYYMAKRTNQMLKYSLIALGVFVVLLYIRKTYIGRENFSSLGDTFNSIYSNNTWTGDGDGSGPGSEPENTTEFRKLLTKLVKDNNANVFVDAPCGACKWTKVWLEELKSQGIKITYLGFDIADEAITKARANLAPLMDYHTIKIEHGDITSSKLPAADILMCRDTLQHLSQDSIKKALANLQASNSKMYLLGGYATGENKDIKDGDYFDINYLVPPYSLKPDAMYREYNKNEDYAAPKYLFAFKQLQ